MNNIVRDFLTDNFIHPNHKTKPCNTNGNPRIEFIDLAKGVCILLVVLFHSMLVPKCPVVAALRMPLYFVLSGLFFKDYGGLLNLIERKTNKLIVPFIFFLIIGAIVWCILNKTIVFSLLVQPAYKPVICNTPIWFLMCLFWINVVYCIISLNVRRLVWRAVCVCVVAGVGYLLSVYNIYLPYFMSSSFTALPFFFIGYLLRKLPLLYPSKHEWINWPVSLVMLVACSLYAIAFKTPHVAFLQNEYLGNVFEIYLLSVALVVGLLLLCKAIKWLPIVSYMGRYSIMILGLHNLVIYILVRLNATTLTQFIVSALVCWLLIPLLKRYAGCFTAQKDIVHISHKKNN